MHQILGLRPYFDEKKGRWEKTDNTFYRRNWGFTSIAEMLKDPEKHLAKIPEEERWNLYYTVAFCGDGKRAFREQREIIFDVDGIGEEIASLAPGVIGKKYHKVFCAALGLDPKKTGLVFSGNGLHFIIALDAPIADVHYFENNKRHYSALCAKAQAAFLAAGLPGKLDDSVFDARRIMRMPNTFNRKEGKPERMAVVIYEATSQVAFDIPTLSGLPKVQANEQISQASVSKLSAADTTEVLSGCDFLRWCNEKPNEVSENQWYAMLSIVPRLPPNGRDLAHTLSQGHGSYSHGETEAKIDQALAASGPRTCANIQNLWGKCTGCKYFGKLVSPILIQGEAFIKTRDTGFHNVNLETGKPGKPNYKDLRKFFETKHQYVTLGGSRSCLTWNGTHWESYPDTYLETFAQNQFDPFAHTGMTQEFKNLICRTNPKNPEWFVSTTARKINLVNGILDLDTLALTPHSLELGFRYALGYGYDPNADCPAFKKFINELMDERQDLIDVLLEFLGYAFSGDRCWAEKALVLTGSGANGKSTFKTVLAELAGKANYSSASFGDIKTETGRNLLDNKLFNLAEETPTDAMADSSMFKNLVSGGEITIKQLYKQQYSIVNKAKLIFLCNELPKSRDTTRGFLRKLIIVPFERVFEGENKDPFLLEKLLAELPGILNLVIAGYQRMRRQRGFTQSDVIDKQIADYQTDLDSVKAWFDDCVRTHLEPATSERQTKLHALYVSYQLFTEARGMRPEEFPTFSRRFKQTCPEPIARWRQIMIEGKREVVYKGVRLLENSAY